VKNKIWNTPVKIRNIEVKNRIVFPPIGTSWANLDGSVSNKMIKNYEEVAKGECGMIVVEGTAVSPEGKGVKRNLCLYDEDKHLSGLKLLSEAIKKQNCFASIQLMHAGGQANPDFTGYEPVSPSKMEKEITGTGHISRELKLEEIGEIKNKFINSALLAYKAGFQAVELHLAHGYLLHEFLSEHTNKREDEYGDKTKLILEIISGIKEKVPNIIIGVRISGEDYLENGINKEVNKKFLPLFEENGVEYFSVSAGIYQTSKFKHEAMKKGEFFNYSKGIKEMVSKPVIGVGKILDLKQAEGHLKNKNCDMVAIGRGQIADPHLVKKTINNQTFNKCIECDQCAYLRFGRESLTCSQRNFEKIVLIMGGNGGIGQILTKAFIENGDKVIIASNEEISDENFIKIDITNPKEIKELFQKIKTKYNKLDVLINAVGTQLPIGPFKELKTEEILKNIEINFTGIILCCKEALNLMKKGKIINFSGGGSLAPRPNFSIYGSSKTALIRFTETLAEEEKNIDINIVAPGALNTKMVSDVINAGEKAGEFELKKAKELQEKGGTSEEILKELILYLASEESNGITGKLISAPWDDWKNMKKENSSLYTLRRIDNKQFIEKND